MTVFEYLRIALSTLVQNKARSFLTMLGVIIGVTAVVLLVALGEAAQRYVEEEFAGLGSNLLLITPGKQESTGMAPALAGSFRPLTAQNARDLQRRARGVAAVAPIVMGAGSIRYEGARRDCMILAVTEEYQAVRASYAQLGRFISRADDDKSSPVCVLGRAVYRAVFRDANPLEQAVTINRRKFRVVGVMEEIGMTLGMNLDDMVFIPLSTGQLLFHGGRDELFQIMVACHTPEDVGPAKESVREILTAAHDYTEDFTITDQASIMATFNNVFNALKAMLAGLASISLLVGGIGIMNIMLVSVRERIREVGIRKAVGATRWDIGMQFLFESVALSLTGGLVGVAVSYAGTLAAGLAYPAMPVTLSLWSVLMAIGFSLAVGIFFGVYPALKATEVDPVEALRYE